MPTPVVTPYELDFYAYAADIDTPCEYRPEPGCPKVALYRVYYTQCKCGHVVVDLCLDHTQYVKDTFSVFDEVECPVCCNYVYLIKIVLIREVN